VLPQGKDYHHPVSALDILPTVIAATEGELPHDRIYDGINLLPYLLGQNVTPPHDRLFWRLWHHGAVRKGDWKLIWFDDQPPRLHNLVWDMREQVDLSSQYEEKVEELLNDYHAWQASLTQPIWRTHPRWKKHSRNRYNQTYVNTLKRN
jgi:arylsulfatase A-like enzyme